MVNSLCREPLETALPEHTDPTKLANEFGTFFLKKIEIIKENLEKFQVQEPGLIPVTPNENLESFSALSIEEVSKIVRESSNASCRLDPVPTWLLKSCLDVLEPPITEIHVPENWNNAVVFPLLKKPGLVIERFRMMATIQNRIKLNTFSTQAAKTIRGGIMCLSSFTCTCSQTF